ncbi:HNH endonuclease family protein [Actinoallomurus sp. NPDC050550]|uniref:HNH endonuclease family protein n=1 Tax=Actinoallomurus sp. NPDC050550 TaxID=3154937 RepID=UPI0033E49EA2
MARRTTFAAALILAVPLTVGTAVEASAAPPTPPTAAKARTELTKLKVATPGTLTGYSRAKFPHWIDQGHQCNTREVVLKRDGKNVHTNAKCAATSGTWYSPYDGATWHKASDVDIDHMVPLAEAWRSGAKAWTTARRQAFANDLTHAQLWAVTDNVNQEKGDKDPALWKPPLKREWCVYARAWTDVKYQYRLTVDTKEKAALAAMLKGC